MSDYICTIEGCGKSTTRKGWCSMHNARWQRHRDLNYVTPRKKKTPAKCSIEGCGREEHGKKFCLMHYKRYRNHGDPLVTASTMRQQQSCSVESCGETVKSLGLCGFHYRRKKRYGDPLAVPPKKVAKGYLKSKVPEHFLAGKDGYVLVHRIVLFEKIGPGWHQCYWCGASVEWRKGPVSGDALVSDHLDHNKQNNAPSNLVAACNPCNGHRVKGESWTPWTPGSPVGEVDRRHSRCRRGHLMTPDNVYIRPDTGGRRCRECQRRGQGAKDHGAATGTRDCMRRARAAGIDVVEVSP